MTGAMRIVFFRPAVVRIDAEARTPERAAACIAAALEPV